MSGPITPESLHAQNEALREENEALKARHEAAVFADDSEIMQLRADNERLKAALDVLEWEREQFILFANTLAPGVARPLLVGPIEVAKWHIERITKALDQATDAMEVQIGNESSLAGHTLTEHTVLFFPYSEMEVRECPEYAAYLRAKEGNHE